MDGKRASSLYAFALNERTSSSTTDTSPDTMEIVLYTHFMEREALLGTMEILVQYGNIKVLADPIPVINRTLQELFELDGRSNTAVQKCMPTLVEKLLKVLLGNQKVLESLTPLPTDSTTQERDRLQGLGATAKHIEIYCQRLEREIKLIGLLLCEISKRIGFSYGELMLVIDHLCVAKWNASTDPFLLTCFLLSLQNAHQKDPNAFSHRFKLDMASFSELQRVLSVQDWAHSGLKATCLLSWICFLEQFIHIPSTGGLRNTISQDLPHFKTAWAERYGYHPQIYEFLSLVVHFLRKRTKTAIPQLVVSSSAGNQDVVVDFAEMALAVIE
ncbi:hypothetical protein HDU91_004427 [Kappamyces sp. JEL0680]|nr:hypothetical protein HDU91_004427 [Kappamyces sp. JEL0680]